MFVDKIFKNHPNSKNKLFLRTSENLNGEKNNVLGFTHIRHKILDFKKKGLKTAIFGVFFEIFFEF